MEDLSTNVPKLMMNTVEISIIENPSTSDRDQYIQDLKNTAKSIQREIKQLNKLCTIEIGAKTAMETDDNASLDNSIEYYK